MLLQLSIKCQNVLYNIHVAAGEHVLYSLALCGEHVMFRNERTKTVARESVHRIYIYYVSYYYNILSKFRLIFRLISFAQHFREPLHHRNSNYEPSNILVYNAESRSWLKQGGNHSKKKRTEQEYKHEQQKRIIARIKRDTFVIFPSIAAR